MDHDPVVSTETVVWTKTKEAIANFRNLLLCSKWSCAGQHAGDGCSVCHSPAWVKDIQINRQLSNITELFRNLEALLNPSDVSVTPPNDTSTQPNENVVIKHKKNFKIWFSPRSRKVRCRVEKPAEITLTTRQAVKTESKPPELSSAKFKDLSVYNFNSSSQDSGSSSPLRGEDGDERKKKKKKKSACVRKPAQSGPKPTTRNQAKRDCKRMRLEAANHQWGFSRDRCIEGKKDEEAKEDESDCSGDNERRSSKRVSFRCPSTQQEESVPEGESHILSPSRSILKEGPPRERGPSSTDEGTPLQSGHTSPCLLDKPVSHPPEGTTSVQAQASPCRAPKRARVQEESAASPQRTPKRPRVSPGRGRWSSGERVPALSTPPPSPASLSTVRTTRRLRGGPRGSPGYSSAQGKISPTSPARRKTSPASPALGRRSPGEAGGSGGRLSQGSPAFVKRNHMGETPLHLAAIKGDVEAVKELLEQGAHPNLKDNAGWTPLHEACNLGHLPVVELLLQQGAMLNTPGYQNDSPLHDAVKNGHAAVARLLLQRGASHSVLNMFGLRPMDYAITEEMQEVLMATLVEPQPVNTPLSPPASLSKTAGGVRKEGPVTLLGSKLTQAQQNQLTKVARLFGGKRAESFSSAVTHVMVPDGPMPSTLTTLQGVLNGCWVLNFSWVKECLQAGGWVSEHGCEAGEGTQRGRVNRDSLLPRLFDGCFFFLLGSFRKPPKEDLLQLIREGGGQLLTRQPKPDSDVTQTLSAAAYHALPGSDQALCTQYIIYDPQGSYRPQRVHLGKVWSAPSTWLLNCISAFQLLPVPEP